MKEIELEFSQREILNKGAVKTLRREGKIPCVVYSKGIANRHGYVDTVAIKMLLQKMEQGFLPSTRFVLKDSSGKTCKAIVKEIQYFPTTYEVCHIDFLELVPERYVELKVPVQFTGAAECVGVKAGGFLRQLRRHVPVRCLPQDIPSHFTIDVKDLEMFKSRVVNDIAMPKGITPRVKGNDVVVSVVK